MGKCLDPAADIAHWRAPRPRGIRPAALTRFLAHVRAPRPRGIRQREAHRKDPARGQRACDRSRLRSGIAGAAQPAAHESRKSRRLGLTARKSREGRRSGLRPSTTPHPAGLAPSGHASGRLRTIRPRVWPASHHPATRRAEVAPTRLRAPRSRAPDRAHLATWPPGHLARTVRTAGRTLIP